MKRASFSIIGIVAVVGLTLQLFGCREEEPPETPTPARETVSPSEKAASAAANLLKEAIGKSPKISFSGVVERYEPFARSPWAVMRMDLKVDDSFRLEHIAPGEKKGSFLVRQGKEVVFSKDYKRSRGRHRRKYRGLKFLIDDVDRLAENYEIKSLGVRKARCGRDAEVVSVAAREEATRPSMKLWIDVKTRKILGVERHSTESTLTFMFFFHEIELDPAFAKDRFAFPKERLEWKPGTGPAGKMTRMTFKKGMEEAREKGGFGYPVRLPGYVPKGFQLEAVRKISRKVKNEKDRVVCQLIYTDGMTVMTIFIADPDLKKRIHRPQGKPRAMGGFRGIHARTFKKARVVLIGELSKGESKKVLDSFDFS